MKIFTALTFFLLAFKCNDPNAEKFDKFDFNTYVGEYHLTSPRGDATIMLNPDGRYFYEVIKKDGQRFSSEGNWKLRAPREKGDFYIDIDNIIYVDLCYNPSGREVGTMSEMHRPIYLRSNGAKLTWCMDGASFYKQGE